jgi:beta-galactosidase
MGFNTIQTYVAWNVHEEDEGQFDFSGDRDFVAFARLAQELGLYVIVRPGPYICAEGGFGGLPAWLLAKHINSDAGLQALGFASGSIRTFNELNIKAADAYMEKELLPRIEPLLYANGGPVILVQVEDGIGCHGNVSSDPQQRKHIEHLVDLSNRVFKQKQSGEKVVLFTAGNADAPEAASNIGKILKNGSSIVLYMAFGGPNFGFWSGANGIGQAIIFDITSYDYSSSLVENRAHRLDKKGVEKSKYAAIRTVVAAFAGEGSVPAEPAPNRTTAFGAVTLTEGVSMFDPAALEVLCPKARSTEVLDEQLGENYGLVLYSASTPSVAEPSGSAVELKVGGGGWDRAQVFLDGQAVGMLLRTVHDATGASSLRMPSGSVFPEGGQRLSLLVENMGRLNYGEGTRDAKGISAGVEGMPTVQFAGQEMFGVGAGLWEARPLPLKPVQVSSLPFRAQAPSMWKHREGPRFFRGTLEVQPAEVGAETYINTRGWSKGSVWVNGYTLGRYYEEAGPLHSLYVPRSFLKVGGLVESVGVGGWYRVER